MHDVISLRQDRGKERLEVLRADRRGLGQGSIPAVLGVQLRRGVLPVVGKDPLSALDGQRYGADLEALQQLGRQVAGAVIGDADRSGHKGYSSYLLCIAQEQYTEETSTQAQKPLDFCERV